MYVRRFPRKLLQCRKLIASRQVTLLTFHGEAQTEQFDIRLSKIHHRGFQ
jgi:hypothetical protein